MKLHQNDTRFVYFNSSHGASHHKEGLSVAASYAFPAGVPFTHEMAADAWGLLESAYPGMKRLQENGKDVVFLSHEAQGTIPEHQGLYPKGAHLNFSIWSEKSEPMIIIHEQ